MTETLEFLSSKERSKQNWMLLACLLSLKVIKGLADSLAGPLYPPEATKKGVTASTYGVIIGFFALNFFMFSLLISIYLTKGRIGAWKFGIRDFILWSFLIDGITLVLFGLLDFVNSIPIFITLSFLLRGIDGASSSAHSIFSVAVCLAFPDRTALVVGLLETVYNVSSAVGPVLGEWLFQLGGYPTPFAAIGLLEVGFVFLAYFLLPTIQNPPETETSPFQVWIGLLKMFRVPSFTLFVVVIVISSMGLGFITTTLAQDLEQFNLTPVKTGLMFFVYGLPLFACPLWGYLVDRTGRGKLIGFTGSLTAASGAAILGPLPFIPLSPSLATTSLGLFLLGVGSGALLGSNFYNLLLGTRVQGLSDSISSLIGVSCFYGAAISLGGFFGSTIAGVLLDYFGFRSASIWICACYAVICISILAFSLIPERRKDRGDCSNELQEDSSSGAGFADEVTPLMSESKKRLSKSLVVY